MGTFVSRAADLSEPRRFPWIADGIAFGGDYSPEQWSPEVWREDVRLMQAAGVTTVSVGIFSWGLLEVADGVFDWAWLDEVLDLLHEGGVGVNLATPTASPPMWLFDQHPEIATVDRRGVRTSRGGRLAWSPSSRVFRTFALRMVRAIAERYGTHPALRMWHVSNEIGNENAWCFSDETAEAWQAWLGERYGGIEALNAAWGTAFWGHRYSAFAQVMPPREARTNHNPGLLLDFERFTSDALLGHYRAERDLLREITPDIPITTNFMIQRAPGAADYSAWAHEVDVVANDHYTTAANPRRHLELSFSADRTRGVAAGEPWMLMEHAAGAVNWQPVNAAKAAGEMRRNSLAHVARGADGVLFFQWRQSAFGAEQLHSAMVPHAGEDSHIFRDVVALGADLRRLAPVRGTRVEKAQVAMIFDHASAAAWRSGPVPSDRLDVLDLPLALYDALWQAGIAVDILPAAADLDGYHAVIVPTQFMLDDAAVGRIERLVESGGHALISYFSGIADDRNAIRLGGYPGAFRSLLGVRSDEMFPLLPGQEEQTDAGWTATLWTERVEATDAEVHVRLSTGDLAGVPVLTRRRDGVGTATYLATRPDAAGVRAIMADWIAAASIEPVAVADPGLELMRRRGDAENFLFALNHGATPLTVHTHGVDLLTDERFEGPIVVEPGGVRVIREARQ
jgi:beta-galactosidase